MASNAFDLSTARWKKSSYSNGSGGDCVEVADNTPGVIPIRDSKNPANAPVLLFQPPTWAAFLASLKR
ncbi:DUF397 domain-containing protein [Streptomyces sp. FZ201]|uniref:DUF397 domain-containing protein n=1 Tax=Streptomyces sp. FZ201 TaxID=3057122 RepID=UPI0021BF404B|nr:DUF397 domain-containing protein [Streptomyces sp. FZ201]